LTYTIILLHWGERETGNAGPEVPGKEDGGRSMNPFVICADASSDMPPDDLNARNVRIVPMTCLSRDEEPRILTGFESEEELIAFYREMREGKMFSTSQIAPGEYEEIFRPIMGEGMDIIYLALSSGLTSTVESARMAAEKLNRKMAPAKVYVVDTLSASGGINLLIEKAAGFRDEGMDSAQAAEKLAELAKRVCHVFMVTDLMHLSRGGRLSSTTAIVGTMLHVIPILIIDEKGRLEVVDRKRGDRSAVRELCKRFEDSWNREDHRMYCAHGNWPEEAVRAEQEILEYDPEARIEKRIISPVIGAHTGPGMLGIIYFGDRSKIK